MNTKGMKFLAVLAVLAMAFAAFAVITPAETDDATSNTVKMDVTVGGTTTSYTYGTVSDAVAAQSGFSEATAFVITVVENTNDSSSGAIEINSKTTLITSVLTPGTGGAADSYSTWSTPTAGLTISGTMTIINYEKMTIGTGGITIKKGATINGFDGTTNMEIVGSKTLNIVDANATVTISNGWALTLAGGTIKMVSDITADNVVTIGTDGVLEIAKNKTLTMNGTKTITVDTGGKIVNNGTIALGTGAFTIGGNGLEGAGTVIIPNGGTVTSSQTVNYGTFKAWAGATLKLDNSLEIVKGTTPVFSMTDGADAYVAVTVTSTSKAYEVSGAVTFPNANTLDGNLTVKDANSMLTLSAAMTLGGKDVTVENGAMLNAKAGSYILGTGNIYLADATGLLLGTTYPADTVKVYVGSSTTALTNSDLVPTTITVATTVSSGTKYIVTDGTDSEVITLTGGSILVDASTNVAGFTIQDAASATQKISMTALSGIFAVKTGSTVVTIYNAGTGTITIDAGTLEIGGNITGNLVIKASVADTNLVILDNTVISGSLTVDYETYAITISSGYITEVSGTVNLDDGNKISEALNFKGTSDLAAIKGTVNGGELSLYGTFVDSDAGLTIASDARLTLQKEAVITFDAQTITNKGTIYMAKDSVLTANSTGLISDGADTATTAKFTTVKAGAGGITLSAGSINIYGNIADGDIDLVTGTLKVTRNLTIAGDSTITITAGTIVISESATVTVEKNAALGAAGDAITNNGTIALAGTLKGAVANNGTISITDRSASFITECTITGKLENVITDAIKEEKTISGNVDSSSIFNVGQHLTVTADTTLVTPGGSDVKWTFNTANLIIPEGITLTVQNGAQIALNGYSHIINYGTIVVKDAVNEFFDVDDGIATNGVSSTSFIDNYGTITFQATAGKTVDNNEVAILSIINNNGAIEMKGVAKTATKDAGSVILGLDKLYNTEYGTILVDTEGYLTAGVGDNVFNNEGTVTVNGVLIGIVDKNEGSIVMNGVLAADIDSNTGYVTLNGKLGDDVVIVSVADVSATSTSSLSYVSIDKVSITEMADTENTLTLRATNGAVSEDIVFVFGKIVAGASSTSTVSAYNYDLKDFDVVYGWTYGASGNTVLIDVSGDTTVAYTGTQSYSNTADAVSIEFDGEDFTVETTLTTDKGVKIQNDGVITVDGTMTYNNGNTAIVEASTAKMVANGMINAYVKPIDGQVDGAMYSTYVEENSTKIYTFHYTTLANAINNGATEITLSGEHIVEADAVIPANVIVTHDNVIIVAEGYTLTVSDGAVLQASAECKVLYSPTIIVYGTMYVANKETGLVDETVEADVLNEGTKDQTYTNIVLALANANSGEVLKMYKDNVSTTKSIEIKDGVTLQIDPSQTLTVTGAALTINGTLDLESGANIVVQNAASGTPKGSVTLNGIIVSKDDTFSYNGNSPNLAKNIAAAYFLKTDGFKYVTPIPYVATVIDETVGDIIFAGDNTLTSDLTLSPSTAKTIKVTGNLTVTKVTMSKTTMAFTETGKTIAGVFADASGSVKLTKLVTTGTAGTIVADASKGLLVSMNAASATSVVTDGAVTVKASITPLEVKSGTTTFDSTDAIAVAKLTVDAGATATVTSKTNVTVTSGVILGNLLGYDSDDSTKVGTVTVNTLCVGGTAKDLLGREIYAATAAAVIGPQVFLTKSGTYDGVAYVSPESTVDVDLATAENVKHVTFSVSGKKVLDVYVISGQKITSPVASVVDGKVTGWGVGSATTDAGFDANNTIAITADTDFNAIISEKIYDVYLKADSGIGTVYFDGKILLPNSEAVTVNGHTYLAGTVYALEDLKKGSYEIDYIIAAGYNEFTAVLGVDSDTADANKAYVSTLGLLFTVGGASGDTAIVLDLYGSTAIDDTPIPEPEPLAPETWSVTTILLLILVILIAIMAVIVAIRLNRS